MICLPNVPPVWLEDLPQWPNDHTGPFISAIREDTYATGNRNRSWRVAKHVSIGRSNCTIHNVEQTSRIVQNAKLARHPQPRICLQLDRGISPSSRM